MPRRSRKPSPLVREDPRVVLARAMRSGQQVAIHDVLVEGSLRASGLVRALDHRTVEITEGERVRRLPLSRVVEVRTVPERVTGVARAIERLAEVR